MRGGGLRGKGGLGEGGYSYQLSQLRVIISTSVTVYSTVQFGWSS